MTSSEQVTLIGNGCSRYRSFSGESRSLWQLTNLIRLLGHSFVRKIGKSYGFFYTGFSFLLYCFLQLKVRFLSIQYGIASVIESLKHTELNGPTKRGIIVLRFLFVIGGCDWRLKIISKFYPLSSCMFNFI